MADPRFIPCDACEGTGDRFDHRPQFDDPELQVRRYGIPCPECDGEGAIEIETEEIDLDDLEEEHSL